MKSYVIAMGMFHINSGSVLSLHVLLVRSCCGIYGFSTPLGCCLFPSNLSVFLCVCVCVCACIYQNRPKKGMDLGKQLLQCYEHSMMLQVE